MPRISRRSLRALALRVLDHGRCINGEANTGGGHEKNEAYQPDLIEGLKDVGEAKEYLNAALEEDDPELFLLAHEARSEKHFRPLFSLC